jgi:23S rRNA pseudouridine1911/1915/1917 synthase
MVEQYQVTDKEHGFRLDQFLMQNSPDLSRTKIRKIIDLGGVHVDGHRVRKCSRNVKNCEDIKLYQDHTPLDPYRISPNDILFQDNYIVVINKPAGVETQPTPARYKGTLYEALQVLLKRDNRFRKVEIGMPQRLDRDTSGAIVFSIHPQSHKSLTEQIQDHRVTKKYLAIVRDTPSPSEGTYHSYLERDRHSHLMKSIPAERAGAKEAITHYTVLKSWAHSALVAVQLITGRTHQIRAHFSEHGHPLLGDLNYGGPGFHEGAKWSRQALHSWKLQFNHPMTGAQLSYTAPVPKDMAAAQNLD